MTDMTEREKSETVKWIKSMSHEEVATYLDEASHLHDLWLKDIVWSWHLYEGTNPDDTHPFQGWTSATTVAEVMVCGTTEGEAWIQYLANLGLCQPRLEWQTPYEYHGWSRHLSFEESKRVRDGFSFESYFAAGAAMGALVRLRRHTGWAERDTSNYRMGWRLTPDGMAHLDGVLLGGEIEIEI